MARDQEIEIKMLMRALELCCESRDRLTVFSLPPEHWIEEAAFDLAQKAGKQ